MAVATKSFLDIYDKRLLDAPTHRYHWEFLGINECTWFSWWKDDQLLLYDNNLRMICKLKDPKKGSPVISRTRLYTQVMGIDFVEEKVALVLIDKCFCSYTSAELESLQYVAKRKAAADTKKDGGREFKVVNIPLDLPKSIYYPLNHYAAQCYNGRCNSDQSYNGRSNSDQSYNGDDLRAHKKVIDSIMDNSANGMANEASVDDMVKRLMKHW